MKKTFLLLIGVMLSGMASAEEPHIVPAPGCPAGEICCPIEAVCGENGCGNIGEWEYGGGVHYFPNFTKLYLTSIMAHLVGSKPITFTCLYGEKPNEKILNLTKTGGVTSLVGDWNCGFEYKDCLNKMDCRATRELYRIHKGI